MSSALALSAATGDDWMRAKVRADIDEMERRGAANYSRERCLLGILSGHFIPEIRVMPAQADIVPLLEQVLENHRRWGRTNHRAYSFAAHFNARCALLAERALAMGDAA